VRHQIALFLLATTFGLALNLSNQPAHALEEKVVLRKMDNIPVFTLLNEKSSPVLVAPPKGAKTSASQIAYFFLSKQELMDFQKVLQKSNPELAKSLNAKALPLGKAIEFGNENKKNKLAIEILPAKGSLDYALKLAQEREKGLKSYPGVPVFALTDKSEKNVLGVKQNGQTVQPFFFDNQDAQKTFDSLKQKNPELAKNTKISVLPFQKLFELLRQTKEAKEADRIAIVPSSESLQYARSLAPNSAAKK
jgi:Tic22-like family